MEAQITFYHYIFKLEIYQLEIGRSSGKSRDANG
jgi:hypothetical protein